jgi:nucleotide-binding universal stress UspA family protein
VQDDDLLGYLETYIQKNKIDIIVLPSYKRNVFSRLFFPGIERKMLFHTDTPLLTLK